MNGDTTMTTTTVVRAPDKLRLTPARALTLVIGVPVLLALIAGLGFSLVALVAQSSFPVSYVIPVQGNQLVASIGSGDITVRQGQKGSEAQLTGRVNYTFARPHVTEQTTASGTMVNVNCRIPTGNCGLTGTLVVPPQTAISLSSGGDDMSVSGVDDNMTLTSGGGDVSVSGTGGIATVYTGGGDLNADDLGGILRFFSAGGDINGNDLSAPTLNAQSGGGDVTLVFTKPPQNLDISSAGGDITVLLPQGSTAYRVADNAGGGSESAAIPVSNSSTHTIIADSGGGDITIAEAS
jgi:hypothetical protein